MTLLCRVGQCYFYEQFVYIRGAQHFWAKGRNVLL